MTMTDAAKKQVAAHLLAAGGYLGSARTLLQSAEDVSAPEIERLREDLYSRAKALDPSVP